jgi:hypothetical protein
MLGLSFFYCDGSSIIFYRDGEATSRPLTLSATRALIMTLPALIRSRGTSKI